MHDWNNSLGADLSGENFQILRRSFILAMPRCGIIGQAWRNVERNA
jgi:hypothetical protein